VLSRLKYRSTIQEPQKEEEEEEEETKELSYLRSVECRQEFWNWRTPP
jgi:hypothetical protein